MKLVIAIVNKDDSSAVASTLNKSGHYVTKLASTGGFLSKGNVTLLIGTDEDKVDEKTTSKVFSSEFSINFVKSENLTFTCVNFSQFKRLYCRVIQI